MGVDEPAVDALTVRSWSQGLVGLHFLELGVELEAALPPV
jgi:hypothetical protein